MLTAIHPRLPMRNKARTRAFYIDKLEFRECEDAGDAGYLRVEKDNIQLHFFLFEALNPDENYGQVYIRMDNIRNYYQFLLDSKVWLHPKGQLELKPWGQMEFSLFDPDNNLLVFGQSV